MINVDMKISSSGKMTIIVDLKHPGQLSKSEKNMVVATTGGNQDIPGYEGYKLGLTIYRPVTSKDKK